MVKIVNCNLFESGAQVICHQVNCNGTMENGIAFQIKERYPEVFDAYKTVCDNVSDSKSLLGLICAVPVVCGGKNITVCNLFGQDNYKSGFCFIDYNALSSCFDQVRQQFGKKSIALPYRMSCSLSGGDWRVVEELILDRLGDCDVTICRYAKDE